MATTPDDILLSETINLDAVTVYNAMAMFAKACEDHARENTSPTDVPHALWSVEALHYSAAKRFAATAFGSR